MFTKSSKINWTLFPLYDHGIVKCKFLMTLMLFCSFGGKKLAHKLFPIVIGMMFKEPFCVFANFDQRFPHDIMNTNECLDLKSKIVSILSIEVHNQFNNLSSFNQPLLVFFSHKISRTN